jgi:hypothetical protein
MEHPEKPTFFINPDRFRYLLGRYGLGIDSLLPLINADRTRDTYTKEQINSFLDNKEKVDANFLKRVDKIFGTGLTWIISSRPLPDKRNMSIFFRKDEFNSDLNLESRKKIAEYEELKTEISIMSKQLGIKQDRKLGTYTVHDDPKVVAGTVRAEFDRIIEVLLADKEIRKHNDERSYLSNLIAAFEYLNIFVFEFIDGSRLREKEIKFNGFFTLPNLIAVKRNQKYMKREIFTLAHELGHYLINTEEIDEVIESFSEEKRIEKWCNDYAFHFLNYENWDVLKKPWLAHNTKLIKPKLFEEIVKINYLQGSINETQTRKYLKVSKDKTLDEVIF